MSRPYTLLKYLQCLLGAALSLRFALLGVIGIAGLAWAQFPITQSFTTNTAPGWVLGGNASLTSGGVDPAGAGYLRLTGNSGNQKGYAYYNVAFPSSLGVTIDFEYLAWGGSGADGISMFLFDGSTTSFKIGDFGGGLGYCQGYSSALVGGLSNAYVGIGLDEFGNFASSTDRCPNGGPGVRPDALSIRGPGNGNSGYAYLTGTGTLAAGIDYPGGTARPAASTYYRRVNVSIVPSGSSYSITVSWQTSPGGAFTTLLGPYTMPSPPPSTLKLGFAASTGGSTNYHEIRNVSVNLPADLSISKTGPANGVAGAPISYTLTASNAGPNAVTGATITDTVPASITNVTWSCSASPLASCGATSGSGNNLSLSANLPVGQTVTVTVDGTISPVAGATTITNTASISPPTDRTDSNPANNTASVNTAITGYTVSGTVYSDLEPDGVRAPSETGTGLSLYAKLAQAAGSSCTPPALLAAAVNPSTGGYSFPGVGPGSYCIVLSGNNSLSDLTPSLPTGSGSWRFVNPPNGQLQVTVPAANLPGQDFGLFNGGQVTGRVFYDNGEGGGTANDALQNGTERGVPNVRVSAAQGSNIRSALTDSQGNYILWLPASLFVAGNVVLSHAQPAPTGTNLGGGSVVLASGFNAPAAQQRNLNYTLGQNYLGYNFGIVKPSLFSPAQSGQSTSPGTVTYSHLFKPGTLGSVTLSLSGGSYAYQVRRDASCDGNFGGTASAWQNLPLSFNVDSTWPRDPDGGLKGCALEVRVVVPAGQPSGAVDSATFTANLLWSGNPNVTDPEALTDTTSIGTLGALSLYKQVRNCGSGACSGAYSTNVSGAPGNVLEYCINYRNLSTQTLTQVVITDPVPFFTNYVLGSLSLNGSTLTDAADSDAGQVLSGVVRVQVGTLGPGGNGQVCYRVQIR
ncbi:MAG: DUF11 domain-containing protein [Thermaceae bacterium]|nr:DUF11 domain-containing protein [Thermaceae bacterium]